MRIAVISDVHGNLAALEAVLDDSRTRGVDRMVNCGDLCSSPLWPRETFELLETLKLPTVRGNHDRWVAELPVEKMSPAVRYTHDALTAAQRNALGSLPLTLTLEDRVFLCHGTPTNDYEYLLEEQHDGRLALARPALIAERLGTVDADLILCGHSHNAQAVAAPGGRLILNPGSVGCPIFADNPQAHLNNARGIHARYAIATKRKDRWSVEFHALAYDWDRAAARARANGRNEWAQSLLEGQVTR